MKKSNHSIDEILKVMPLVQEAVRKEIGERMSAGDDIYYVADGNIMINNRVVKPLKPLAGAAAKRAQRRAA